MEFVSAMKESCWGQVCVGVVPEGTPRGHSVKLWSWSLDCLGDSQDFGDDTVIKKSWWHRVEPVQEKEMYCIKKVDRYWRYEEHFDIRYRDSVFGVCLAGFWSSLGPVLPHYTPFFMFGMVMFILRHFMLEVCNQIFILDFRGITLKRFYEVWRDFKILLRLW